MRYLLMLVLPVLLLSSCKFSHEYEFKEDLSGSFYFVSSYPEFREAYDAQIESGEIDEDDEGMAVFSNFIEGDFLEETVEALEDVNGVSNVDTKNDAEYGEVRYNYDFRDLSTINRVNSNDGEAYTGPAITFERGDGWVSMNFFKFNTNIIDRSEFGDVFDEIRTAERENGFTFLELNLKLSFPWKIKKLKTKGSGKVSYDRKSIKITTSMLDFKQLQKDLNFKVKFEQ